MAPNMTAGQDQDGTATAGTTAGGSGQDAAGLAAGALDVARDYAERVYETGHRRAEEAAFYAELGYEEARDWARAHPGEALAIAAGIGLLFGLVVARR